jgi:hypothetical protein
VARGKEQADRDPHRRFAAWLETSTDEGPPRDLAVHATVCVGCQQRIAAIDMLTAIDPALAGIPEWRALPTSGWLRATGRSAVVVGGVAALMALGIGSWRLIQASNLLLGPAVESPTQAVLGGTGLPAATASPSALPTERPSVDDASPSEAGATSQPSGVTPSSTISQPTPPPAQPTARPTNRPAATPRPLITPSPTPPATVAPTSTPTPLPTPEATPAST